MQTQVKAGDKLYNGAVVTECFAKQYNAVSARIQRFIDDGREPPEYLLNGRHHFFVSFMQYSQGE